MFRWPLSQIDATDIETLIPFVFRYPDWKAKRERGGARKEIFADQADWL